MKLSSKRLIVTFVLLVGLFEALALGAGVYDDRGVFWIVLSWLVAFVLALPMAWIAPWVTDAREKEKIEKWVQPETDREKGILCTD